MTQNGDWMSRNAGFCIVTFVTLKKKGFEMANELQSSDPVDQKLPSRKCQAKNYAKFFTGQKEVRENSRTTSKQGVKIGNAAFL